MPAFSSRRPKAAGNAALHSPYGSIRINIFARAPLHPRSGGAVEAIAETEGARWRDGRRRPWKQSPPQALRASSPAARVERKGRLLLADEAQ
jgi:hypothetical protein